MSENELITGAGQESPQYCVAAVVVKRLQQPVSNGRGSDLPKLTSLHASDTIGMRLVVVRPPPSPATTTAELRPDGVVPSPGIRRSFLERILCWLLRIVLTGKSVAEGGESPRGKKWSDDGESSKKAPGIISDSESSKGHNTRTMNHWTQGKSREQDRAGRTKTGQDKTGQDRTRQETGYDGARRHTTGRDGT